MSDDIHSESKDRRAIPDRRRKRMVSFVLRERRSGFDRRWQNSGGVLSRMEGVTRTLRDRPDILITLLIITNILNLFDFGFTLNALASGAAEANPVMRSLFDVDPLFAGLVKFLVVLLVTLLIWQCRRFRSALQGVFIILGVYLAVFFYHIVGIAFIMQ